MSRLSHRALLLQPLLFATALPLALLAAGAAPAHAGSVSVTGGLGLIGLRTRASKLVERLGGCFSVWIKPA
jgi:hypothetical protein